MNTAAVQTKRKNIDIREDVYRFLSIKAAASGTNLKSYIEALLEKEVEDMNEAATYQYLCTVRPDGDVELSEEETKDFEKSVRKLLGKTGSLRAFFIFHIQIIDDCVFFKYLVPRGEAYDKKYEEKLRKDDK